MSGVSNTAPLRRVLQESFAANDLTTDKVADAVEQAGLSKGRGRTWLNDQLKADNRKRLLYDDELAALSVGYRVPVSRLREADLEGHGLMQRMDQPAPWILEDEVTALSSRQRAAVKTVISAMIDPAEEAGGTVTPLRPVTPSASPLAARRGKPEPGPDES